MPIECHFCHPHSRQTAWIPVLKKNSVREINRRYFIFNVFRSVHHMKCINTYTELIIVSSDVEYIFIFIDKEKSLNGSNCRASWPKIPFHGLNQCRVLFYFLKHVWAPPALIGFNRFNLNGTNPRWTVGIQFITPQKRLAVFLETSIQILYEKDANGMLWVRNNPIIWT